MKTKTEKVTHSMAGDVIQAGRLGERTVAPACANKENGQWFCVTHQEGFQHNWDMWGHREHGRHVIVWICFEHGPEQP